MKRYFGVWCHVGGKGHEPLDDNYGWPHVVGCVYFHEEGIEVMTSNCIFCGKEILDEIKK